jgi:DNA-binding response OmpR family regulator
MKILSQATICKGIIFPIPNSNTGDKMSKVLIIEDELKIQQIVKAYLQKEGLEVLTAGDGAEGLRLIKEANPDLIILDLMLPAIPGEEILARLRQTSEIPVIILSAKSSEDERIFGLNIGADDYLIKPFSPRELVARVQAHLRRTRSNQPAPATAFSFNDRKLLIDTSRHEVYFDSNPIGLTPTEFKILQLLSQTPGQVFSRSQLLEQTQGTSYEGYDRTIDSHIKNLRQKIEPDINEPSFILTVFGIGYKFGGSRD